MGNEELQASSIETSGLRLVLYPMITSDGSIEWNGTISLVSAQMCLVSIMGQPNRQDAQQMALEALKDLIGRLLDLSRMLIDKPVAIGEKVKNERRN